MSVNHAGNIYNEIMKEEHQGELNAKRVSLVSSPTIFAVVNTSAGGNVTVQQGNTPWITSMPSGATVYQGTDPWRSLIVGNVTLSDSKGFIGLTSTILGASPAFIGIVTVVQSNTARSILGNLTLSDAKAFIGLVSVQGTVGVLGNTTVLTRNAGTNKTLTVLPVVLSTASILNVATATNTWKMTSLLLNSNATVRINIKSGATYLTGNASLGINLNPGGGWVETGAPDAPIYFALTTGQTITVEKFDYSGVISQIGGKVVYFDE